MGFGDSEARVPEAQQWRSRRLPGRPRPQEPRLGPPLHVVYLTSSFLTRPTWSGQQPVRPLPQGPFLPGDFVIREHLVSRTGRAWSGVVPASRVWGSYPGFLGFSHSSSSPARFGIGRVWHILGWNGVTCPEMPEP